MTKRTPSFGVDWRALYLAQDGRCFYCHRPIQPTRLSKKNKPGWTCDHFIPRSKGGRESNNCVISCDPCNTEKSDRLPTEIEAERFGTLLVHYTLLSAERRAA